MYVELMLWFFHEGIFFIFLIFKNFFFCFFKATPMAYEGSQAKGPIRAVAAGLHHSHSNAGALTH